MCRLRAKLSVGRAPAGFFRYSAVRALNVPGWPANPCASELMKFVTVGMLTRVKAAPDD